MNLSTDPWIPVRMKNGSFQQASLTDIFNQSKEICDLSLDSHERVAVMRLLICITQAAIGFPEDDNEWDDFGGNLKEQATVYLEKWKDSFELLGNGKRFLQAPLPTEEKSYPSAQLFFTLASGNTATLLNNRHESIASQPEQLALALLCYQNFFVGGSMAKKVKGNGPSLKALHTFIQGDSFNQTLLYNCVDSESLLLEQGRPIWEIPDNMENATLTYLGRMVPTPCKIWLNENCSETQIDQGFIYPEYDQIDPETSATKIVKIFSKKEVPGLLRANLGRGIWRDLHCITVLRKAEKSLSSAPLIIQSHFNQFEGTSSMKIWCGELIKAKDAKILDAVESIFQLPLDLFSEQGRRLYDQGVQHANLHVKSLAEAVRSYGKSLYIDKPDSSAAVRQFWHALDQQSGKLIEVCQSINLLDKGEFGLSSDPWSMAVHRATITAYENTCPRNTPRQIRAYAAGLSKLFPNRKKKSKSKIKA